LEWSALMTPTLPAKTGTTASGPNASTRAGPAKVETFFKSYAPMIDDATQRNRID